MRSFPPSTIALTKLILSTPEKPRISQLQFMVFNFNFLQMWAAARIMSWSAFITRTHENYDDTMAVKIRQIEEENDLSTKNQNSI